MSWEKNGGFRITVLTLGTPLFPLEPSTFGQKSFRDSKRKILRENPPAVKVSNIALSIGIPCTTSTIQEMGVREKDWKAVWKGLKQ